MQFEYTKTITLSEIIWVFAAYREGPLKASEALSELYKQNRFKEKLPIPDNIDVKEGSDSSLNNLLALIPVIDLPIWDSLEELAEIISPFNTINRPGGDCKSLAVLSIAYKRKAGIPARLYYYGNNHVAFEELINNEWIYKDPQSIKISPHMVLIDKRPHELTSDFNDNYLKIMKMFND